MNAYVVSTCRPHALTIRSGGASGQEVRGGTGHYERVTSSGSAEGHDILPASTDSARREPSLDAQNLARRIVEIASDKQASDIVLLDIRPVATVADYFVVASTASDRQMTAVVRDLEQMLREEADIRPLRVEGVAASGWILIDYGDVIVHLFSADRRAFYRLEELWSTAVPLVRMQ